MATTARLALSAWRNDDVFEFPLRVRGLDLTNVAMRMQVRLTPDTPGAPLIDLAVVTNGNAQGLRVAGVAVTDGLPVSDLRIRINKTTLQALPYSGEIGDSQALAYALQIAGRTRLVGDLIVLAHAIDSDAAPISRPGGSGESTSGSPAAGATLTITVDDGVSLTIDGADLIAPQVAIATDAAEAAVAAASKVQSVPNAVPEMIFRSADGFVIFRADATTNAAIDMAAAGVARMRAAADIADRAARRARVAALRDTLHVLIYGQSLAYGYGTGPVVSGAAPAGALRFEGGVRPLDGGSGGRASLVPLIETNGGTNGGETVASGAALMIAQLLDREDASRFDEVANVLFSAPAEGGTPIAGLVSGTAPFDRLKADVTAARALAGASYALGPMLWLQGESDQPPGASTSAAAYIAALRQLRIDVEAWGHSVAGNGDVLPVLMYQTATLGGANVTGSIRPTISIAQLALADDPAFAMVSPAYPFPYYGGYDIHLSAQGERLLGAYFGLAMKRLIVDGVRVVPLRPSRSIGGGSVAARDGNSVAIRFDVAGGRRLVLDTAKFPGLPSGGFNLARADGSAIVIEAVEVISADTVRIDAASAIPAGAAVRYGWNGQQATNGEKPFLQGCLRDDAGEETVFDPGGDAWPMHNWCAIFEEVLS